MIFLFYLASIFQNAGSRIIFQETFFAERLQISQNLTSSSSYLIQLTIKRFPLAIASLPVLRVINGNRILADSQAYYSKSPLHQLLVENATQVNIQVFTQNLTGLPEVTYNYSMEFEIKVTESGKLDPPCKFPLYGRNCENFLNNATDFLGNLYAIIVPNQSWYYGLFYLDNNNYELWLKNHDQILAIALLPLENFPEFTTLPSFNTTNCSFIVPNESRQIYLRRAQVADSKNVYAIGIYNFNSAEAHNIDLLIRRVDLEAEEFPTWAILVIVSVVVIGLVIIIYILISMRAQARSLLPKPAVDRAVLDRYIPKLKVYTIAPNEDSQTCCICLLPFEKGQYIRQTPCEHNFHSECLQDWTQKQATCPVCRQSLREADLQDLASRRNKKVFPDLTIGISRNLPLVEQNYQQFQQSSSPFIPDLKITQRMTQDNLENSPQNQKSYDKVLADHVQDEPI